VSSVDAPNRFLVIGTHRTTGGLFVWCGVSGFHPIQRIVEKKIAGQLVNQTTAQELVREIRGSSSDYKFEITILPVRDVTFERSPILLPH
jgi:hypothetical protein